MDTQQTLIVINVEHLLCARARVVKEWYVSNGMEELGRGWIMYDVFLRHGRYNIHS